ncbi:glycosyltransferase family 2 protein [Paenibacillus alginolyticus]|uniref:glycosyltransferase family 2 protein n=1 Tax=Paenibacillus alginolyticus TaxID=59839 RepID=UPI00040BD1D9|nr:glycosyltransferase family 2 protein [Paenibacillus alginolyticus]MCY9664834.1 glycosyltransferase family 2 protein [Paenibacillus alginolyticus]
MKILIIVPAFNESRNLVRLLKKFKSLSLQFDIVVINDCSTDNTSEIAKKHGVIVIDLPCNLGIGGAVQTGYLYARNNNYDVAIQVDGDGQHNPEYIENLIAPIINRSANLVIGSRYIKKEGFQSSYLRRIGISYFKGLIQVLCGKTITDPTSGFRACDSNIISLFASNYPKDYPEPESIVFLLRNNFKVLEVPVVMNDREAGKSSIRSFKTIYYMIKVSLAILIDVLRRRATKVGFEE